MKRLVGKARREVRDIMKGKAQLEKFELMSPTHKAFYFTAAGITLVIAMIICYLTGLWAHNNEFVHALFG